MASEYTPNRRYPLYTDTDKPNLRDQYNGAIREIDADMAQALQDSSVVASALGAGFDAQHTVRMALDAKADNSALTNETTARESADTALGTRITNETSARESADTALGTRITNETSARESADTALGTRIDNIGRSGFSERKFILYSDSFGSGIYTADDQQVTYTEYGWERYLKAYLRGIGITVYNNPGVTVGNAGFTSSAPFDSELVALANNMSQDDRDKVTDIIAIAGTNDRGTNESTIQTAVQTFIDHARTYFKNAQVCVGYLASKLHSNVINAYRTACGLKGARYLQSLQYLFLAPNMICVDGIHPTAAAYQKWCPTIISGIFGEASYNYEYTTDFTLPSGYSWQNSNNPMGMRVTCTNSGITVFTGTYNPGNEGGIKLPNDATIFSNGSAITMNLPNGIEKIASYIEAKPLATICQTDMFVYYSFIGHCFVSDNSIKIFRRSLPTPTRPDVAAIYMNPIPYFFTV